MTLWKFDGRNVSKYDGNFANFSVFNNKTLKTCAIESEWEREEEKEERGGETDKEKVRVGEKERVSKK